LRLVLDANVLISGLISPSGAPARLLERWLDGALELVVCDELLNELERALALPKLRARVDSAEAAEFVALIRDLAERVADPTNPPPVRSPDPGDDYLIALAAREQLHLVSGDSHLLGLGEPIPVLTPRAALDLIERRR
jgi:putative PIN family toxin of toxin-antitoxin system